MSGSIIKSSSSSSLSSLSSKRRRRKKRQLTLMSQSRQISRISLSIPSVQVVVLPISVIILVAIFTVITITSSPIIDHHNNSSINDSKIINHTNTYANYYPLPPILLGAVAAVGRKIATATRYSATTSNNDYNNKHNNRSVVTVTEAKDQQRGWIQHDDGQRQNSRNNLRGREILSNDNNSIIIDLLGSDSDDRRVKNLTRSSASSNQIHRTRIQQLYLPFDRQQPQQHRYQEQKSRNDVDDNDYDNYNDGERSLLETINYDSSSAEKNWYRSLVGTGGSDDNDDDNDKALLLNYYDPSLFITAASTLTAPWDDEGIPILDDYLKQLNQELERSNNSTQTQTIQFDSSSSLSSSSSLDENNNYDTIVLPPVQPRIVGGSDDSELDSFVMHLRYVEEDKKWKFAGCGGSLISRCHILTAAHCMSDGRENRTKAVYVNAWRPFDENYDPITGIEKPYHVSLIDRRLTILHPQFNNTDNSNDVAILTMTKCIEDVDMGTSFEVMQLADSIFWNNYQNNESNNDGNDTDDDDYIKSKISNDLPSLPPPPPPTTMDYSRAQKTYSNIRVAGFGQTGTDDISVPPTLQSVDVALIGRDDCEQNYNINNTINNDINDVGDIDNNDMVIIDGKIKPDMYCAGSTSGGKDACLGDSGGPNYVMDRVTSKKVQLGIVSWGISCALEGYPGVYTSVAYHYDFIRDSVCGSAMATSSADTGTGSNSNSSSIVGAGSILSSDLCFSEGPSANSKQDAVAKSINDEITFRGDEDLKEEATEVEKEIEEDSISQQSLNQSCSGKNSSCDDDNDCCDDFICHKRDMICKRQHRQKKERLNDGGSVGGSASSTIRTNEEIESEIINIDLGGLDRQRRRRKRRLISS